MKVIVGFITVITDHCLENGYMEKQPAAFEILERKNVVEHHTISETQSTSFESWLIETHDIGYHRYSNEDWHLYTVKGLFAFATCSV